MATRNADDRQGREAPDSEGRTGTADVAARVEGTEGADQAVGAGAAARAAGTDVAARAEGAGPVDRPQRSKPAQKGRKKPAGTLAGLGSGTRISGGGVNIATTDLAFGEGEALRVEDVMRILHLSRNTVYKLAREGVLPSYRVGRQMRFRYDDVRRRLESEANLPPAGTVRSTAAAGMGGQKGPSGETTAVIPGARSPKEAHSAAAGEALPVSFENGDVLDELPPWARGSIIIGGQDLAGDVVANYVAGLGVKALRSHANGYVSLARMYMGTCHAAVVDLWSESERRYNAPYLRQMLPGVPAILFRLYKHRVGLTVPARDPLKMRSWVDLLKPGVMLANREHGAGTRVLLDEKLKYMEADGAQIKGYDRTVTSELAQALLVARGLANVAVTSEKPYRQMKGLDFLPMQDEYVGLAVLRTPSTAPFIRAVRSLLKTDAFRSEFDPTLYDVSLMGEIIYEC